jgi:hypothetical protein
MSNMVDKRNPLLVRSEVGCRGRSRRTTSGQLALRSGGRRVMDATNCRVNWLGHPPAVPRHDRAIPGRKVAALACRTSCLCIPVPVSYRASGLDSLVAHVQAA